MSPVKSGDFKGSDSVEYSTSSDPRTRFHSLFPCVEAGSLLSPVGGAIDLQNPTAFSDLPLEPILDSKTEVTLRGQLKVRAVVGHKWAGVCV